MYRTSEGVLNIFLDVDDYASVDAAVFKSFNVNAAELLKGGNDNVLNIFGNLGYVLKEKTSHNGVLIIRFEFAGDYSPLHEDVLKWFVTNFDVYVEANFHSDDNGEHERWGFKGEDQEFENILYLRTPAYQLQSAKKAKEKIKSLSNLVEDHDPRFVYSVKDLKELIVFPVEDFESFNNENNVILDFIYTGKLTLGATREQYETVVNRISGLSFFDSLPLGDNPLQNVLHFFGGMFMEDPEQNEKFDEVLEYTTAFEQQAFKEEHIAVLNWLATVGVGVYLEACDSFEDGLLIEAAPESKFLTFQKTYDVDVNSAAVSYIRVNLLNELAEHVCNEATVEEISGMFSEFESYVEDEGLNISFDVVRKIFEPLTVEGY